MTKEENFIIFSDIKRLFFKTKWVILTGACFFGGIGFFIRSQVPVRHEVTAIFKEVGQTQTSLGNSRFDTLLHSIGIGGDKQEGHVLLLSSIILEPVVEKLGMQAEVSLETTLQRKRRFLKESLNAERGRSIQEPPHFIFSHVRYKGEEPRRYQIFFTSRESFEVRKGNNQVAATGLLGEPVVLNDVIFTLNAPPKDLRLRHNYSLTISPLAQKVLQLRKLFEVTPLYGDASLLSLEMIHSDRSFAICVLNEVMESYKNYLTRENARVTEGQLAYLEKRRDDYMDKMDEHLEAHMQYLKESLATKGALNLGQHLPLFQSRKQELMSDLMSIDLKISELLDTDPHFIMDIGHEVASLQKELHQIAKERDALTLAFVGKQDKDNTLEKHLRRLDVIEQEELRVKTGVDTFFSSLVGTLRQRDQTLIAVGDFGKVLSPDANQLKKVQQEKKRLIQWAQENAGVRLSGDYLKHQLRLLSLQEGALKQRLFHGTKRGEEYQGIDLDTARRLLLSYVQERDQAASKIAEMIFAKQQIDQDHAEWVSLAAIFPDAISQEMVKEMGEMKKQLRKERMLTEKERERLEKKFSRMKEDLFLHIAQTLELSQLEKERNEDRITSVRMAILDLLGQEVSLIEKQIEDRIEEKLAHLEKEKELVSGQLSAIKAEMKEVPDAWLREHRLKFAADMNKGMLEALVQLVESKSIENNLSILESRPIDFAHGSLSPKPPLLKVFGVIGALLGGIITFAICFMYYLYRGFPLTLRNMRVRGKKVVGPLKNGEDLEGLRRFALLIKEEERLPLVVCLVLGTGLNYTLPLAEILSKEGKSILVIDLDFKGKVKERNLPGLIHFLEGESKAPSIRKKSYGDYIPLGGNSKFGEEILRSQRFQAFLDEKKKAYDVVLLSIPSNLQDSLPKAFLSGADIMALYLEGHSFAELQPYFAWESDGHSLAFV